MQFLKWNKEKQNKYKQLFTDAVFEFFDIPTRILLTYNLIDADKEPKRVSFMRK